MPPTARPPASAEPPLAGRRPVPAIDARDRRRANQRVAGKENEGHAYASAPLVYVRPPRAPPGARGGYVRYYLLYMLLIWPQVVARTGVDAVVPQLSEKSRVPAVTSAALPSLIVSSKSTPKHSEPNAV